MKKGVMIILLIVVSFGFGERHADFSGKWSLNLRKSKNLPASFKNVKSYSMDVEQAGDSVVVAIVFEGGGQRVELPPTIYAFDGKERYREDTVRLSQRWITSSWTTTGQKLIVTSRVIQRQGGERRYRQTDIWELTNRNTLRVHVTQEFEGNDSTFSEQRLFHRLAD